MQKTTQRRARAVTFFCLFAGIFFLPTSHVFFVPSRAFAQTPDDIVHIRIPLWAELDAYPGFEAANSTSDGMFDYSIGRLKQLAPFMIGGMVNGWNFSYTPSDKLRGVEEYIEFSAVQELGEYEQAITYVAPLVQDSRLTCWIEFTRTPHMVRNYQLWASITHETIHGVGYGKISDGFDGLTNAVKDAIRDAVREHFRTKIKNKPKEIRGKVLIRRTPLIGIDAGRYKVQLDFFLETDRIVPYTQF